MDLQEYNKRRKILESAMAPIIAALGGPTSLKPRLNICFPELIDIPEKPSSEVIEYISDDVWISYDFDNQKVTGIVRKYGEKVVRVPESPDGRPARNLVVKGWTEDHREDLTEENLAELQTRFDKYKNDLAEWEEISTQAKEIEDVDKWLDEIDPITQWHHHLDNWGDESIENYVARHGIEVIDGEIRAPLDPFDEYPKLVPLSMLEYMIRQFG